MADHATFLASKSVMGTFMTFIHVETCETFAVTKTWNTYENVFLHAGFKTPMKQKDVLVASIGRHLSRLLIGVDSSL